MSKMRLVGWVLSWIILAAMVFVGVVFGKRTMSRWDPKSCFSYKPSQLTRTVFNYQGPTCDLVGGYMPVQGVSGISWCVDENGERINGTEEIAGKTRKTPCKDNSIWNTITRKLAWPLSQLSLLSVTLQGYINK